MSLIVTGMSLNIIACHFLTLKVLYFLKNLSFFDTETPLIVTGMSLNVIAFLMFLFTLINLNATISQPVCQKCTTENPSLYCREKR